MRETSKSHVIQGILFYSVENESVSAYACQNLISEILKWPIRYAKTVVFWFNYARNRFACVRLYVYAIIKST